MLYLCRKRLAKLIKKARKQGQLSDRDSAKKKDPLPATALAVVVGVTASAQNSPELVDQKAQIKAMVNSYLYGL